MVTAAAAAGYHVVAVARQPMTLHADGVEARVADVTKPDSIRCDAYRNEHFDVVVSCIASRTGAPQDARAIDHQANSKILKAARSAGVGHFVYLSAICVQKPRLAFQYAKLAFERELVASGINWTIVRPTAFFKSLSGQIERVRLGKPFLLFGNGELTSCKPISDSDLAQFVVNCFQNEDTAKRVLPIGGPGPAITPIDQGTMLFELTGQHPRFRRVRPGLFLLLSAILRPMAAISKVAAEKSEYLRITHYYATESMLVWNRELAAYSADETPEFGSETLDQHYRALL